MWSLNTSEALRIDFVKVKHNFHVRVAAKFASLTICNSSILDLSDSSCTTYFKIKITLTNAARFRAVLRHHRVVVTAAPEILTNCQCICASRDNWQNRWSRNCTSTSLSGRTTQIARKGALSCHIWSCAKAQYCANCTVRIWINALTFSTWKKQTNNFLISNARN